ncbi:MAG: hypothetical protein GX575_29225 [Candidatus Anammoximicrobium sp.]|mgnify:CR=1 FL=1|nr:hypothetical protein [Candidatus Anammoximicrobium sp.]
MELTQKTFAERLGEIRELLVNRPDEFDQLGARLREKGVECVIVVPMLEVVLDFNTLRDIAYEQSSDVKFGQRFDFLLDGCFLVEAKPLGALLDDHHKQIIDYIRDNPAVNYGLLTNGVDFQVWVKKTFIESTKGTLQHLGPVVKVLELSLRDDSTEFVLNALQIFRKERYIDSFKRIAGVAAFYGAGGRGRPHVLHQDKDTNEVLTARIKDAVCVKKGYYYDDVVAGRLSAGDNLRYKSDCVEITVELTKTGTVILRKGKANVLDVVAAKHAGWGPMIPLVMEKWAEADTEHQDPIDIIKLAQNKQKLHRQDEYRAAFERVN